MYILFSLWLGGGGGHYEGLVTHIFTVERPFALPLAEINK